MLSNLTPSHAKPAGVATRRPRETGATVDAMGSIAAMVFLWLIPAVALLLALLRS
jgi:hypothetical protein